MGMHSRMCATRAYWEWVCLTTQREHIMNFTYHKIVLCMSQPPKKLKLKTMTSCGCLWQVPGCRWNGISPERVNVVQLVNHFQVRKRPESAYPATLFDTKAGFYCLLMTEELPGAGINLLYAVIINLCTSIERTLKN